MKAIRYSEYGTPDVLEYLELDDPVPAPGEAFRAAAKYDPRRNIYQTEAVLPTQSLAPGASAEVTTQLFAGAKEWETIRDYQETGIDRFIDSIDWGWFFFLTKPIFWLLHELNKLIGNMGVAIIGLTLLIKAVLFPLAYKSYVSMARMKELQPEMEKLKKDAGDDRQKMQQGMMELYKKNKVNPAAGCLPILLQIPIFFSLYKVIFVTLELRHAPWILWIDDLSAPDPSSILNLFGLLPFDPPGMLHIGVLPILLGVTMFFQFRMQPMTDPVQKQMFSIMPWVMMVFMAPFAAGLQLYWVASNLFTIAQQRLLYARHPELKEQMKRDAEEKQREREAKKASN